MMWYKKDYNENGEYLDADGKRVSLDWGHHVQAPDGKCNAELGYTEYASLEEAAKAFGLAPAGEREHSGEISP